MTVRPLASAFIAALVSGCASAVVGGGEEGPESAGALLFGPAVPLPQEGYASDPMLAVAADGSLWAAAISTRHERPVVRESGGFVWRSADGGASWEVVRAPVRGSPAFDGETTRPPFSTGDVDLETSADGWVYHAALTVIRSPVVAPAGVPGGVPLLVGSTLLFEASGDGGRSWTAVTVLVEETAAGTVDAPRIVAGEGGDVWLFYTQDEPTPGVEPSPGLRHPRSIRVLHSADYGATWSEPVVALAADGGHRLVPAHARRSADGTLFAPYWSWPFPISTDTLWTQPAEARVVVSADGGATWEDRLVAAEPLGFGSLVPLQAAAMGTELVVAWTPNGLRGDPLKVGVSADGGRTWDVSVVHEDGASWAPYVAVSPAGRLAVARYAGEATGEPEEAPEGSEWHVFVAERSPDGEWTHTRASASPIAVGPACSKGGANCGGLRSLDWLGAAFHDERLVLIHSVVPGPDETIPIQTTFVAQRRE